MVARVSKLPIYLRLALFGLVILVVSIGFILPEKTIEPTPIEPTVEVNLSACQLYYRDVFMQAKEYGQFEDFPATTTYAGPIATLDEDSHPVAKRFYSYHKAALDSGEVDFGGRYAISDWAFTGWGQMFAVVDLETGKVFPFPYAFHEGFDYRPDSNLIVINPKHMMPKYDTFGPDADLSCDTSSFEGIKSYYFVFENEQFKLLGPEDTSKLSQPGVLE